MYLILSVHITCLAPVCVLVSISLNASYLCNTCVCACFQFTTYHLYVYMYLIQSLHAISAGSCSCLCVYIVHMHIFHEISIHTIPPCVQFNQYIVSSPISVCMSTHVRSFISIGVHVTSYHY